MVPALLERGRAWSAHVRRGVCCLASADRLTLARPDDWHLHLRDKEDMQAVLPHSARMFRRAIIMPNLRPPVVTTDQALAYKRRITQALPAASAFQPLMTLYLTDRTPPEEVARARDAGVVAFKLYPAGATTNSDSGVTDISLCLPTLRAIAQAGLLLLVHGEVTDPAVDFYDRERVFIDTKLRPLLDKLPELRVVLEHITTRDAAELVAAGPPTLAATVTPQHMLLNRNALFQGGLRPHNFCLPILKREVHREAVLAAATSGHPRFFLGTDSAPHARSTKEADCGCAGCFSAPVALPLYAQAFEQAGALDRLEAFASFNGPDFYGMPRNSDTVTLVKEPWRVPDEYAYGAGGSIVPFHAGQQLHWRVLDGDACI